MKKLANELFKRKQNKDIEDLTQCIFDEPRDFMWFIREETRIHAARMSDTLGKNARHQLRRIYRRWLRDLRSGIVDYV